MLQTQCMSSSSVQLMMGLSMQLIWCADTGLIWKSYILRQHCLLSLSEMENPRRRVARHVLCLRYSMTVSCMADVKHS